MERRRSALPPLTPFAYHGAWFSRANHEGVPPHVDDLPRVLVSASSDAPVVSEFSSLDISAAAGESGSELTRFAHRVTPGERQGLSPLLQRRVRRQGLHTARACYCQRCHKTPNAAIDRPATAARSDAVDGPCRIACWADTSFEDLIRPLQQRTRNLKVECAGGSLIDDQIVRVGLLDGEVGRSSAL